MLGKLIKHEFESTGRLISLILISLIIITPITACYLKIRSTSMLGGDNILLNTFEVLCVIAYVCAMIAAAAATVIILLSRFYQSMVTKESYLTHTLPVKTSSLIISKTLVACVWQIVSIIVMILSIFTFAYIMNDWTLSDLDWDMICNIYSEIGLDSSNVIFFAILLLTSLVVNYLKCYLAFALGHLFNNHPFAGFVIAYIVISIISSIISSILSFGATFITNVDIINTTNVSALSNAFFIFTIGLNVLFGAICYIGTVLLFKKKLNI